MIKTSNFLAIARDQYLYLFFLVADRYWIDTSEGRDIGAVVEEAFARDLGERGAVVTSFLEDRDRNHQLILSKPWPSNVVELLDGRSDPILLVISHDFMTFDPRQDDYALVLLGNDVREVIQNLKRLAKYVRNGEGLFDFLKKRGSVDTAWRRLAQASELKPGAFGFTVDLKQLVASFGGNVVTPDVPVIASGHKRRR